MTDSGDVIARCPAFGTLFAVPAHVGITDEFAEIAKLAGALDFAREVDCPECRTVVNVQPGETVEVGDTTSSSARFVSSGTTERARSAACG